MATKKETLSKDKIVSLYMDYILENTEKPKTVYQFMKLNGYEESEFYAFFGSVDGIEKEIYSIFLEKTLYLLHQNKDYETYDMKTKVLSFYFTFFELLTANRSYVALNLKGGYTQLQNLTQLSGLRTAYQNYILSILTDDYRIKTEKIQKYQEKAIAEGSWLQFLVTLQFWLTDTSPSFEKTDIFIEKSVKATFELMNLGPLESLIDFGKFIFKEKMKVGNN